MSIKTNSITYKVSNKTILKDISLEILNGEIFTIIGPNGSGKSTFLKIISGDIKPTKGEVLYNDILINNLSIFERAKLRSVMTQSQHISYDYSVKEIIEMGWIRNRDSEDYHYYTNILEKISRDCYVFQLLNSNFNVLSGGEKKRVHFARTLMQIWSSPDKANLRYMFLDEPTSGLDPRASQDIARRVRQLADRGRIVFLVTHDLTPEIMAQVDHMLVMAPGGRTAFFGPPNQACRWFGVSTPDGVFNRFSDREPAEWAEAYRQSPAARTYVETREQLLELGGVVQAQEVEVRTPHLLHHPLHVAQCTQSP